MLFPLTAGNSTPHCLSPPLPFGIAGEQPCHLYIGVLPLPPKKHDGRGTGKGCTPRCKVKVGKLPAVAYPEEGSQWLVKT